MQTNSLTVTSYDPIIALVVDGLNSAHSERAYEKALADFFTWYDGQGRPQLRKSVVQAYRSELLTAGFSPSTVNQRLSAIRKLALEAADNGLMDEALAAGIGRVKGVKSETVPAGRNLSAGEIAAMFDACANDPSPAGARDAALLALLRLGLRRAEVARLQVEDYDATEGAVKVMGKGRKQRTVPLMNGAAAALADWLTIRGDEPGSLLLAVNKGGRVIRKGISPQAIYDALNKRAAQANVKELTPHDWRRSFVGDLLDAGADLSVVQKLVGHADPKTTARYDRRPEEAKRKAVGLLHVPYRRRGLGLG